MVAPSRLTRKPTAVSLGQVQPKRLRCRPAPACASSRNPTIIRRKGGKSRAHHFDARIRRRVVLHAAAWDDPFSSRRGRTVMNNGRSLIRALAVVAAISLYSAVDSISGQARLAPAAYKVIEPIAYATSQFFPSPPGPLTKPAGF